MVTGTVNVSFHFGVIDFVVLVIGIGLLIHVPSISQLGPIMVKIDVSMLSTDVAFHSSSTNNAFDTSILPVT